MTGTVDSVENTTDADGATRSSITMTFPSTTDMNAVNLPDNGVLTINSRHYNYDSWEATIGPDGITSIKFNLTEEVPAERAANMEGSQLVCGETVDALGVPYYQSQITEFVRNFVKMFNDIEKKAWTSPEVRWALSSLDRRRPAIPTMQMILMIK